MTMEIDRTVELAVNGLTCGHCVQSVTEELSEVAGMKNVDVILNSGATSKVTLVSDVALDDDALREAVSEAGFELVSKLAGTWPNITRHVLDPLPSAPGHPRPPAGTPPVGMPTNSAFVTRPGKRTRKDNRVHILHSSLRRPRFRLL